VTYGPIRHIARGGESSAACGGAGFTIHHGAIAFLDHGAVCLACAFMLRARALKPSTPRP